MARATSPVLLHGLVGNVMFKVINGTQYAYQASDKQNHKRMLEDPVYYKAYRYNQLELGGASLIATEIYHNIKLDGDNLKPIFRPYSQNIITGRLKKFAERDAKMAAAKGAKYYASYFSIADTQRALTGLDLSHDEAPSDQVKMIPLGPRHDPTAIQLLGLERAAEAIKTLGNARLEFRIHVRQANCKELTINEDRRGWNEAMRLTEGYTFDAQHGVIQDAQGRYHMRNPCEFPGHTEESEWIPAEIIPKEGFTLDLPTHEDHHTFVTAVMIEWREQRTTGRRIIKHHKMGIVRIVSVHGPAEAFPSPAAQESSQDAHSLSHCDKPLLDIDWQKDPKAYLAAALGRFKPK
jgi:hypothetical protein